MENENQQQQQWTEQINETKRPKKKKSFLSVNKCCTFLLLSIYCVDK